MDSRAEFLILPVIAACITFLVVNRLWLRRRGSKAISEWAALAKGLLWFLVPVFIVLSFVAEPYFIPSGSMVPTIDTGDVILVDKAAYGLRLPWTRTRLATWRAPQRGDVVVFNFPGFECNVKGVVVRSGDASCREPNTPVLAQTWIKRVVGVPGDHVRMMGENLWINGKLVNQSELGPYHGDRRVQDDQLLMSNHAVVWQENFGGRVHNTVRTDQPSTLPGMPSEHVPETLPPGCYIVLGDNRDESEDSRKWGCLPQADILGRVDWILVSHQEQDLTRVDREKPLIKVTDFRVGQSASKG